MSSLRATIPTLAMSADRPLEAQHQGRIQLSGSRLVGPSIRAQLFQGKTFITPDTQIKTRTVLCSASLNARCGAEQTQTVTRESSTITIAPVSGKEKSPDLDDGGDGFPPRDDGDGGGGGGGGGGNWSDQVQKENPPDSHLNKTGYKQLCEEFFKKSGKAYDKAQMKNHWDQTKEQWKYWTHLPDKVTGAGYDHRLKTFASGKDFWDDWFKTNPKCQDFSRAPLKFPDECEYIFGRTTATCNFQFAPNSGCLRDFTEGPVRAPLEDSSDIPGVVPETQQQSFEEGVDPMERNADDRGKKKYSTCKKRIRLSGASRLNNSLEKIADVIETRNKNASSSQPAT